MSNMLKVSFRVETKYDKRQWVVTNERTHDTVHNAGSDCEC